jgi:hypothetical protein
MLIPGPSLIEHSSIRVTMTIDRVIIALSLMAGEVASLLLSRMSVPILYYLDKRWEFAHRRGGATGH